MTGLEARDVLIAKELFPGQGDRQFRALFDAHGKEVRNRPLAPQWQRYREMQNRFVWVVARDPADMHAIGYSGHYWYVDLHFGDRVAADDLWFVAPEFRGRGIGRRVREIGLQYLRAAGVVATYDLIREGGPNLEKLGYERWGQRWMRKF